MEAAASMLVAPKPSLLFSRTSRTRGRSPPRSSIVAGAGKEGGRLRGGDASSKPRGAQSHALLGAAAMAATAMSSSGSTAHGAATSAAAATAMVVVGELDQVAAAKAAIAVAGPALSGLGFLFIARIVMSWYPRLPVGKFPYVVAYAPTEPILAATRRVIPPLGGVDVTPVVWFGLVSFLSEILVGPQGLLVLLSQQTSS